MTEETEKHELSICVLGHSEKKKVIETVKQEFGDGNLLYNTRNR